MSNRVLFISGRFPNYIKSVPCILINNQVISGNSVFEYFGKLVEGKKEQEQRQQNNELNESDQGQCRINEDGELEGYLLSQIYDAITGEPLLPTPKRFETPEPTSLEELTTTL